MSITLCPTCHHEHSWCWEDAFYKFGFEDGDGFILTEHVAEALRVHGYAVKVEPWGCHNITIASIKRGQMDLIPVTASLGYDDPRSYLPKTIVGLLDAAFPPDGEVEL